MREPVPAGIKTFREFWPYYVREHLHPVSRVLHVTGTSLSVIMLVALIALQAWTWLWLPLVFGYGFAWIGHFVFEKNKPATFRYPLFSLRGDFKMLWRTLSGRIGEDLQTARANQPEKPVS